MKTVVTAWGRIPIPNGYKLVVDRNNIKPTDLVWNERLQRFTPQFPLMWLSLKWVTNYIAVIEKDEPEGTRAIHKVPF
jgi:hypothetical protein